MSHDAEHAAGTCRACRHLMLRNPYYGEKKRLKDSCYYCYVVR